MCTFYWSFNLTCRDNSFRFSFFPLSTSQAIDAKTIKDVCTKYIFDKAPAIAAVGMFGKKKVVTHYALYLWVLREPQLLLPVFNFTCKLMIRKSKN